MGLTEYKKKRDFKETPEPKGKKEVLKGAPIFVVQKHAARALHYDFRLEVGGTLKSWAVPKGPPENTGERRLAVMVEDHPLEYATFEGEIPQGHYGAGIVEIWDKGTYVNLKEKKEAGKGKMDMEASVKEGQIEVELKGKKLKGPYALVRTKMGGKKTNWLLIKMKKK